MFEDIKNVKEESIDRLVDSIAQGISKALNKESKNASDTKSVNVLTIELDRRVELRRARSRAYINKVKSDLAKNKNCTQVVFPTVYKEYQPYFVISICNCSVTVPADGKPYTLHNDFASVFHSRLAYLDKTISESKKEDIAQAVY